MRGDEWEAVLWLGRGVGVGDWIWGCNGGEDALWVLFCDLALCVGFADCMSDNRHCKLSVWFVSGIWRVCRVIVLLPS